MRHCHFAVASIVASLLAAGSVAQASSVPVTFGTPDVTDVSAGFTSQWDASWDYSNTGSTSARLFVRFQPDQRVTITPGTTFHAINTKGAGANDRFSFSSTGGSSSDPVTILSKNYVGHVTLIKQRIEAQMRIGAGNGVDNAYVLMDFDITPPTDFTFASDPVLTINPDNSSLNLQALFSPPAGFTGDVNAAVGTIDVSASASPVAVPEPTSAALLFGAAALLARRRRRA